MYELIPLVFRYLIHFNYFHKKKTYNEGPLMLGADLITKRSSG